MIYKQIIMYQDDDVALVIKDLDTGQSFSIADFGMAEISLPTFTQKSQPFQSQKWKNFWDKTNEINEKLSDACESGQYDVVLKLLKDQFDLKNEIHNAQQNQSNNRSSHGSFTAEEYQEFVGLLDVNSKGLDDWTALHHAVNGRHEQIVRLLIESKANPNLQTHMKRTPLHLACLRCSESIVRILLQTNVDVNSQDSDFNTPLHIAAELGQEKIVKMLLESGANATLRNYQQKMPFDMTMSNAVRELLRSKTPNSGSYNQRAEIQGMIVRNSRSDHIEKLLGQVKNISQMQPLKIEEPKMVQISINMTSPDCYNFHKLLGKGSFGEVYLASHKTTGEVFAIKTLNKDRVFTKNLTRYAQTEKNVLSVMKHPFIVRLHAAFQTQAKLFMVLDYCPGGDLGGLLTKVTKLTEEKARFYISEILLALEDLHKSCIIFRDLKPDNVVLDEKGHARLTDFGLAKEGIYNNSTKSFCGSIAYLAPEVLMKRGHSRTVDWYLLGVLLYEMIVGIPPYYNQNRDQLFENIKKGVLKIPKFMSEEARDLIKQLLIRDPAQRLGNKNDGADIKAHSFFKGVDWDAIYNKKNDGPYLEKDKSKTYLKDKLEMKFEDSSIPNQRLQDWSFVQ